MNNVKSEVNLSDIIWNNQNIKYQGKTLYFNQWIRDGVVHVSQIVKHLRLYSLQEIKRMVKDRGKLLFQYIMLRDAMSKVVIQTSRKIGDMKRFYNSRDIKSFLWVKVKSDPICQNMWKSKFKDTVCDWKHMWLNHCFALREAKINSLMWKIIHNIYPTSMWLHKLGITDSENCSVCNELETIEHFFVTCRRVVNLWRHIEHALNIRLNTETILFGIYNDENICNLHKYISVALLCISRFKHGNYSDLIGLYENECMLRKLNQ